MQPQLSNHPVRRSGIKVLALKFILFEFNIFPVLLFSILLVGLQICISYGVSRSIEKDTLVERLRTE